jgi:predicted transcriptional regulator
MKIAARSDGLPRMATKPKREAAVPELNPAYVAAIEEARAEVDAGKIVPCKAVHRWLLSWGATKELPRPRCK